MRAFAIIFAALAACSAGACAQPRPTGADAAVAPSVDIGGRLLASNQPEMAANLFERMIAERGPEAISLTGLGAAYFRAGRATQAMRVFRAAIALDPNFAMARNNLGVALYQDGDYEAALSEFERAFAITGGLDPTIRTNVGIAEIAAAARADEVEVDDADFDVIQYGQGFFRLKERDPSEKAAPKTAPPDEEAQS